jgi:hypothetical protein
VQLIERYFGVGHDHLDSSIEALILVVLFMLIATVALWVGKTAERK